MIWAINNEDRIKATPKSSAKCPVCKGEVISKCGVVKSWHWAHRSNTECDSWYEPESEWHLKWKSYFNEECQEVIIENHRADIKNKGGTVIEIQNSQISPDDVCDRELFYNKMIWLLNGDSFAKKLELRDKKTHLTFVWKNFPKSFFYSDKEIYVDLEKEVKQLSEEITNLYERLSLSYNKLEELIEEDPKKYSWGGCNEYDSETYPNKYMNGSQKEKEEIMAQYKIWSEISEEIHLKGSQKEFYNERTILVIKKVYKKQPATGWGFLITKKNFIRKFGGNLNEKE